MTGKTEFAFWDLNINTLTAAQLRQAAGLKEKIAALQTKLEALLESDAPSSKQKNGGR